MSGVHPASAPQDGEPAFGSATTPDRLVEISVTDADGRQVGHGSGWLLDDDLILTAAHVLWPAGNPCTGRDGDREADPDPGVVVEVRRGSLPPYARWHRCDLVWSGRPAPADPDTGPDAALLAVTGAGWRPPDDRTPPRLGGEGTGIVEFEVFGFPAFFHTDRTAYDVHQCGGRLRPANLNRSDLRTIEVAAEDAPESPDGWQGESGAAVLIEGHRALVGVVVGADQGNARRLTVLPVARLTEHPGFRHRLRDHRYGAPHNRRKVLATILLRLEHAEPLATPAARRALLDHLLPDDPDTARLDPASLLPALVDHLATTPDGCAALAAAFTAVCAPHDDTTATELTHLAEELHALDLTGVHTWCGLREALQRLVHADLGGVPVPALYARAATDPARTTPPAHCDDPWKAFVHLVCTRRDTPELPPALRFLELLASAVGGTTADTVRACNRHWALRLDIARRTPDTPDEDSDAAGYARQVDELRARLISAPVQRATSARLLVELTPDPDRDLDDWTVSFYFQCRPHPDAWQRLPMPFTERSIALRQLFDLVQKSCGTLHDLHGVPLDRIEVEYILPLDLIDHPDKLIGHGALPPAAASFPLVVHSLDRLQHSRWRAVWQDLWQRTRRGSGRLVCQITALDQSDAAEPVTGVLLTQKPGSDIGRDEVSTALRHGVPLVMWRHDPRAEPDFTALSRRIMAEGRLDVRHFHQEDVDGPAAAESVWNRQFVVIFDTPDNLPGLVYGEAS
ncbi:MAG TPA: hypothetical protein VIU15_24145 [Streptomyces sp.]